VKPVPRHNSPSHPERRTLGAQCARQRSRGKRREDLLLQFNPE